MICGRAQSCKAALGRVTCPDAGVIPSPGIWWWLCHVWGGQGEGEPGGPFLTSMEGWHAWKRHPGRGWAGGDTPCLNTDKTGDDIWFEQVVFWLIFPSPQVIRGSQHCWAGQDEEKDQKHTFTPGLRGRDLSLHSSNSVGWNKHRSFWFAQKVFHFPSQTWIWINSTVTSFPGLLVWLRISSLRSFFPSFFHPADSPKLTKPSSSQERSSFLPFSLNETR